MAIGQMRGVVGGWILAGCLGVLSQQVGHAQKSNEPASMTRSVAGAVIDEPDAQRTREEFSRLLDHYPPALRGVFGLDPALLANQAYLAPYPGLAAYITSHPEIVRNPAFFTEGFANRGYHERERGVAEELMQALAIFCGFGMAIGLLVWLIRTLIDYRRWHRLSKVQTDVHTKLLDRFTQNDELLAYIQSPAGAKFLESSPITLDAGPRSIGAPFGRILWSMQAGVVLIAGGGGLQVAGTQVSSDAAEPLRVLGVLAVALGVGFVVSAIISYVISQRMGLIESAVRRTES